VLNAEGGCCVLIFTQMVHYQWLARHTYSFILDAIAISPECTSSHCVICYQALPLKKIPSTLRILVDVKTADFMNS
jgi:hypothetical protein